MEVGDPRLPQRFWDKIEVDPETGCWPWVGYTDSDGYGRYTIYKPGKGPKRKRQRSALAHRVAKLVDDGLEAGDYFTARDDKDAHHRKACIGRHCVNPDHQHWEDRQAHRWHEAKMANHAGDPCTGTAHCCCYECCELRAIEADWDMAEGRP